MNQAVSNSPAAGGDLQSVNLDSATEAERGGGGRAGKFMQREESWGRR